MELKSKDVKVVCSGVEKIYHRYIFYNYYHIGTLT